MLRCVTSALSPQTAPVKLQLENNTHTFYAKGKSAFDLSEVKNMFQGATDSRLAGYPRGVCCG